MSDEWEQIGEVWIDAGMLTLVDVARLGEDGIADAVMERAMGGPEVKGVVVVSSGLGDGIYPVEVRKVDLGEMWGGAVAEVRVRFLPHPVLGEVGP